VGKPRGERLFGRSLHDSIGLPGLELVHPEDLELVLRSLTSVQSKETGTLIEVSGKDRHRMAASRGYRLARQLVRRPSSSLQP